MEDQEIISGFLKALSIPMHISLIEIFHLQERKRLNTPRDHIQPASDSSGEWTEWPPILKNAICLALWNLHLLILTAVASASLEVCQKTPPHPPESSQDADLTLLYALHRNHQLRSGPAMRQAELGYLEGWVLAGVSPGPRDLAPSQQGIRCSCAPPTQKEMQAGTRWTWSCQPQLCFEMASKEEEAKRIEWGCFESSKAAEWSILWKRTVRAREDLHASALDFLSSTALSTTEKEMRRP